MLLVIGGLQGFQVAVQLIHKLLLSWLNLT